MKNKKILTLDNLFNFFQGQKHSVNFDAKESGYQICIHSPAVFEQVNSKSTDTMMFGTVMVYHLLRNRNGSGVTLEAAENSKDSIKYKPILANFWTDPDTGEEWFTSHDMTINDDGSIEYQQRQVGCFTSQEPRIVHDDQYDKDYLVAECAIPRTYTHATQIIEREGGTKGSVQLLVNSCSYNAKQHYLELNDIEVSGYTLLGKNPETGEFVGEGMIGSKVQLKDFAADNKPSHMFTKEQQNSLINTLNEINNTLKSFNKNNDRKEENTEMAKENINENLAEENLNENSTENFEEENQTEENQTDQSQIEENQAEENESQEEDIQENEIQENEEENAEEPQETENESEESPSVENHSFHREVTRDGLKFTIDFEVSHEDIRNALYNLISSWDSEDNDWYFVTAVYDDRFVATGYFTNQIWGQKYSLDGNNVNLEGDRYSLHVEYLTDEETEQLNNMRSNYAELTEKVSQYELAELNAQRDEILNSDKYAQYQNAEEFKTLRENKENYSLEDLRTQCELAFAAQFNGVDGNAEKQTFAQDSEKKEPKKSPKMFAFLQKEDTTNDFLNGLMGRKK